MKAFKRIIPAGEVTLDDVAALASRKNWPYLGDRPGSMVPGHEWIWTTPDRQTAIAYVDDQAIDLRYLAIQGARRTEVANEVRAELTIVDKETVLGILRSAQNEDDLAGSLYLTGAFANELDQDVLEAIESGLRHPSPRVRQAAIFAALMAEWQELEASLERLQSDGDQNVQETAKTALEHLRPHWDAQKENR